MAKSLLRQPRRKSKRLQQTGIRNREHAQPNAPRSPATSDAHPTRSCSAPGYDRLEDEEPLREWARNHR
jgi:hypothetical protein